ncbi:cytochrome c550 [Oceanobacillus profundus]|uniref:Cytochrome c n=1 Tax=Oceanobacillus profundus TaxID=372463 RepID=A0A417YJD4_9BACI|nr:cytochrome c [Oceanobacillus profundus]MBR3121355.1 cytochrome c [Oceanobacillus sp.]PAE31129.1 cytochrome C [Paenibacillus sp. 7884-2]MCM3396843.1 cytochrome c [Oceanobacillus profundus]MDO6448143.1 cytochrome c [Oceanobacillus profundus]RHW33168.1 cytochrome c [Oceanobacillus profundus]
MRRNPVVPYAIIAILGVLTVVIISFVGLNQRADIQVAEEGGSEQTEESQEGETTGGDPEAVFQANCAACHGGDLSGGMGPALTTVGSTHSADEIADIIQNGIGSMPAQSQVAGEELTALSEWLSEQK